MYREHFGLDILPFKITPDPAFLYEHSQNRLALNMLRSGLAQLGPISVVCGDVGTGKTTLILDALRDAPEDITLGLLSNHPTSADDILPWVLATFDIPVASDDATRLEAFGEFVGREHAAGRTCVLIVDEAQNVAPKGLEQLRRLADLNRGTEARFNLILVGQTELFEKLQGCDCAALAQQIGITIRVGPMTAAETDAYIRHRLAVAGGNPEIFDPGATAAVHEVTGGYPRAVNLVCDTAMVMACGAGDRHIGQQDIRALGEDGSVLSHLPAIVEKARNLSIADMGSRGAIEARSDTDATDYFKHDVFEFAPTRALDDAPTSGDIIGRETVREKRGAPDSGAPGIRSITPAAGPEPVRQPVAREPDATAASRLSRQGLASGPARKPGVRRSPLRFLLGGAVAASVVAAGVVALTVGSILNESGAEPLELAALEAAPAALNRVAMTLPEAPAPLEDMPGKAFLDRALSAGFSDPRAAAIDYARAALRGEDLAAYYLGQLYETGDGVPRDLGQARAWYASVEDSVRGARRRLEDLGPPLRTGELAAPTPLLGGTLESGGAEFVWMSGDGADPTYFVVELSDGPSSTVRRLPPQILSALRIDSVAAARFWRIIAVAPELQSYAASDWFPLGAGDATRIAGSGDVLPQAVVRAPDGRISEPFTALTEALDASRIPYRVEAAGQGVATAAGLQIGYFFEGDEEAARTIADALGGDAGIMLATVSDRDQAMPVPGQIVIFPAPR